MKQHETKPAAVKPPEVKPPVAEVKPPAIEPAPPVAVAPGTEDGPTGPTGPTGAPAQTEEEVDPAVVLASLVNTYPSDLVTASGLNAKLANCREDLKGERLEAFDRLVVLCAVAGVSTPVQFNAMAEHLGLKVRAK